MGTLFFRDLRILRSLSWEGFGWLVAFAAALAAWTWSGMLLTNKTIPFAEHADYFVSLFQRSILNYLPAYLLVALADGLDFSSVRRRRIALGLALFLGVVLTVQVRCAVNPDQMFYVNESKMLPYCTSFPTWRTYIDFPAAFIQPITIGAMMMIFIFTRRRDSELVEKLHRARGVELEARRQRIESEIEAMQSRVDPDGLLETLRTVRAQYEAGLGKGEALLDKLIADLRHAARHPLADEPGPAE